MTSPEARAEATAKNVERGLSNKRKLGEVVGLLRGGTMAMKKSGATPKDVQKGHTKARMGGASHADMEDAELEVRYSERIHNAHTRTRTDTRAIHAQRTRATHLSTRLDLGQ